MAKKFTSIILVLLMLCSLAAPVLAAEAEQEETQPWTQFHISSPEELVVFAENCRLDSYSQNLDVFLDNDIDLTGIGFASIPTFSGSFNGNGHTISGLSVSCNGSTLGLFRYLTETAVVKNLTVKAAVHPSGSRDKIGTIAGSNAGLIQNCTVETELSGNNMTGGIAGFNAVSGIIENCAVWGSIQGIHFVGGIAGQNNGVIRNCESQAAINITAQQNEVDLSDITLGSLTNSEQATTVTDVGGIAGISSGVIRSCKNAGNVGYQHMGYNIGGIAGTQSGYIVDCENTGNIQGRKEVGGIVGQMEPVSLIEYEEDALQILQAQLQAMGGTVNETAANVQATGSTLSTHTAQLQDHVQNAKDSVELLIPDPENPKIPDADTIQAAQNGISSSLSGMQQTVQSMSTAINGTLYQLSGNMNTLQGQINAMSAILGSASENLGGSIQDVSDADTAADLTGKVERCTNYGSILGDMNVGGIAGAMAMENDWDTYADWEFTGDSSLNFESEVRCVILNCENSGTITVKKSNGGGIAGWQSLGLVKLCGNSGTVDGQDALYVGGISGQSTGFIRNCSAKCSLSGQRYVGGIAGSAAIATDCFAVVKISGAQENCGAILGDTEDDLHETETPFAGNFYLVLDADIGGIDGISYDAQAQPLPQGDFFAVETLPELFRNSKVTFRFEDGTQEQITIPAGDDLDLSRIPALPEKDGYSSSWDGLDEADLSNILFDLSFEALYTSHSTVIQSDVLEESGKPLVLIEGDFYPDAVVLVSEAAAPVLEDGGELLGAWQVEVSQFQSITAVRLLIPEGCDTKHLVLYICGENNQWADASYTVDDSYAVVFLDSDAATIAMVQTKPDYTILYLATGVLIIISSTAVVLIAKRKKRR